MTATLVPSSVISLCLSVFICKMGLMVFPLDRGDTKMKGDNTYKAQTSCLGHGKHAVKVSILKQVYVGPPLSYPHSTQPRCWQGEDVQ